jgi:hypothetical protein
MADSAEVRDFHGRGVFADAGTTNAVPFIDSAGKLVTDKDNLSYVDSTNVLSAIMNVKQATAPHGFYNLQFASVVTGTDTAFADGTQFITSIFLPVNKTLTGAAYLVGSVGGTNLAYAVLYNADGAVVAQSATTGGGVTVGTAATVQSIAFQTTYAAVGPAMYYVGVSANGNTAKIRTVPANLSHGIFAGSVAQTHGTIAAITEPTTFTADKAPYVYLY